MDANGNMLPVGEKMLCKEKGNAEMQASSALDQQRRYACGGYEKSVVRPISRRVRLFVDIRRQVEVAFRPNPAYASVKCKNGVRGIAGYHR